MIAPEKITEIDLPAIMEAEGIELQKSGQGYRFRCIFHSDKNPSAGLYRKSGRWRWHCFGCQAGGDSIDFIQRLHGLDFKGACQHMGIESKSLTPTQKAKIKKNKQKQKITDAFKKWELAAIDELRDIISTAYQISGRWKTIQGFECGAMWLDPIAELQGQLDVLMMVNLADRHGIYRRWKARGGWF